MRLQRRRGCSPGGAASPPPRPHPSLLLTLRQGALCDDDAEVRTAAGGVFNVLFKSGGSGAMDSVIPALLGGLDSEAHAAQVRGLPALLAQQPGPAGLRWRAAGAGGQPGPHAHPPTTPPLLPPTQALEGLRVVLGVRPQLLSVMVPRLIKPPVSSTNLRALGALAEVAGAAIHPHLAALMPALLALASRHPDVSPQAAAAHQAVAAVALAVQVRPVG